MSRTRWGRFALSMVLSLLGVGVILTALSQGALAASLNVSGSSYKLTADRMDADGMVQYGSVDERPDGGVPVMTSGFKRLKLDNFCQSFTQSGVPFVGTMTVTLRAPGQAGMTAKDIVIATEDLRGDVRMDDVELGADASELDRGPEGATGTPGTFGMQSETMHMSDLRLVGGTTTAATLRLDELDVNISPDGKGCF